MATKAKTRQTRARTAEARAVRRERILDAAETAFAGEAFADIHMSGVAKSASLAKGTLYLYFDSKEALFLAVVERRMAEWFAALREALSRHAYIEHGPLAEIFVQQLRACRPLPRLFSLLHSLEQNVTVDQARSFRLFLAKHIARLGIELERLLPALVEGQGARVLIHIHAIIAGVSQMAEPSAPVAEALRDRELAHFDLRFDVELTTLLTAVFRGVR